MKSVNFAVDSSLIGYSAREEAIGVIAREIAGRLLAHPLILPRVARDNNQSAGQFARRMIKQRRRRDDLLDGSLFGEPVWDMLLYLFVSAEEKRQVSVSSLCVAAAVPSTTALRHINLLVERGMVLRTPDRCDARRILVNLSSETQQKLRQVIEAWMKDASS